MKNKVVLFVVSFFVIYLTSCLENNDEYNYVPSGDAQVYRFHLKSDSVPALDSVLFAIDQLNGKIYNVDSMAYGTVIKDKVICTVETRGVAGIQVKPAGVDTLTWWNTTDSLDFSGEVQFVITPVDGLAEHKKYYTANINIHTVKPDSMTWNLDSPDLYGFDGTIQNHPNLGFVSEETLNSVAYRMFMRDEITGKDISYICTPKENKCVKAGDIVFNSPNVLVDWGQITSYDGLYITMGSSNDGTGKVFYSSKPYIDWSEVNSNISIHRILGVINETEHQKSYLAAVGKDTDGKFVFVRIPIDLQNREVCAGDLWETGSEVEEDFPLGGGFARLSYENMYHPYLLLVGGSNFAGTEFLNTVWNTSDGLKWVKYESSQPPFSEGMVGASLVEYDDMFYLLGGINHAGQATKNIVCSIDRGLSWQPASELVHFPEEYKARAYSSVFVTPDNYLLILGGRESLSSPYMYEAWKGRINRLGFKNRSN